MKNDIKEMRDVLVPDLPNMLVVGVDSPEQYVEYEGLGVAQDINCLINDEQGSVSHFENVIRENLDLISDKDIDKLKKIVSAKKANIAILQDMVTTYDEIDIDKSAKSSLKKLLKGTE